MCPFVNMCVCAHVCTNIPQASTDETFLSSTLAKFMLSKQPPLTLAQFLMEAKFPGSSASVHGKERNSILLQMFAMHFTWLGFPSLLSNIIHKDLWKRDYLKFREGL